MLGNQNSEFLEKNEITLRLKFNQVSIDTIDEWIKQEFGDMYCKFKRNVFSWDQLISYKEKVINGVYLFYIPEVIWKIGKHHKDAVVRARNHVIDNTGSKQLQDFEMKLVPAYANSLAIVIYTPVERDDIHWIHALETFLELKARKENVLLIRSARVG